MAFSAAQVVTTGYDAAGRAECTAVRMNPATWSALPASACVLGTAGTFGSDRITRTSYDAADRVTGSTSAYGTAEQADDALASYGANGQVTALTDGAGNGTGYVYDGFDRLLKTSYPVTAKGAGTSSTTDYEQLGYDAGGNVTSVRLRDGQTLSYAYDALGRRVLDDNPGTNVAEADVAYTYDNLGTLTRAQDANGWYSAYAYDALGRTTAQNSSVSTTTFSYDPVLRQKRQTWADGFYVVYDYDVSGQMTTARENGATSGAGVLATFGYDDLGRRVSLTRGNGVVTSYGYDAVSRLSSLGHDLAGTASDVTTTFGYNPAGQIATRSVTNDVYAWPGSAAATIAYTANGLNQYSAVGSTVPTYDARGNMTNAGGPTYQYNSRNELYSAGTGTLYYRGPNGLLGQALSGGVTTNFDNVDGELTTERDATTGQVQRRYVFGPGVDEPLVWYEGAGTSDRRWLAADERGSVIAVTNASGSALAVNRYDDYGQPASGNLGRFQYTGQRWFSELGLYDYKARMYDPKFGRFPQPDPIGYYGGANLYGYTGGDPINFVDPTGLRMIWACVGDGAGHEHCGWEDDGTGSRAGITFSFPGVERSAPDGGMAEGSLPERHDGDTRCYPTIKHFADQLQGVGNGIQTVGKVLTGIGLAGDLAALAFPPAEIATGGFTALGAGVIGIGNAISGASGVLDFAATGNYQRAGLNAIGFVAGRLSSKGDAHQFVRGVALDEAVNGAQDQTNTSCH